MGKIPIFQIFLSYSSTQGGIAEKIYLSLKNAGHKVFFDRTNLPPGREYDRALHEAIRSSDIFIFLVSPESVAEGSYARSELRFARDTWPSPDGKVLPVLVAKTDFASIPNYLTSVTVLRPEGNIVAEVSSAIGYLSTNTKPEETIASRVGAINSLERKKKIEELDKKWKKQRKEYCIKIRNNWFEPSALLAVYNIIFICIFSLVLWSISPYIMIVGSIIIIIVIRNALAIINNIEPYREAKSHYIESRKSLQQLKEDLLQQ